jgi:hypothetical protein
MACCELGEHDATSDYVERIIRLARVLGARRFEAQALEFQARNLLDTGRRVEAAEMLREALAICREAGMQFCGPKVISALSRVVDDPAERATLLAEGRDLLGRGSLGHNHLWFFRDAAEAHLSAGDPEGALRYVAGLEDYARTEPLPWSDLFVARGRTLVGILRDGIDDHVRDELVRLRVELESAGLMTFLPAVTAMLVA